MKKLTFAVIGTVALMTGACSGGNDDQVNNAELNQGAADNLNELANAAATNETQVLGNQQEALNQETSSDTTVNPEDADEQNVSGM